MDHQQRSLAAGRVDGADSRVGCRHVRRPGDETTRDFGGLSRIVCSFSSTYRLLRRVVVVRDCDEVRIYFAFFKTEIRILNVTNLTSLTVGMVR